MAHLENLKPPENGADPKLYAQYWFRMSLYPALRENNLTQQWLADKLGRKRSGIWPWFQNDLKKLTLPTLVTLRQLKRIDWEGQPQGKHGRFFNEAQIFYESDYTDFEELLMDENKKLKEEVQELKQALNPESDGREP